MTQPAVRNCVELPVWGGVLRPHGSQIFGCFGGVFCVCVYVIYILYPYQKCNASIFDACYLGDCVCIVVGVNYEHIEILNYEII